MRVDVIFRNGPNWNPDDHNVVFHHINHGVPEDFMKESLNWIFKLPISTVNTEKPEGTDINWITQICLNETATASVAVDIKEYYEKNIIPELSKVGYDITVVIEA